MVPGHSSSNIMGKLRNSQALPSNSGDGLGNLCFNRLSHVIPIHTNVWKTLTQMIQQTGLLVPVEVHWLGLFPSFSHVITNLFHHSIAWNSRIHLTTYYLASPFPPIRRLRSFGVTDHQYICYHLPHHPNVLLSFLTQLLFHGQSQSLSWIYPHCPCLSLCCCAHLPNHNPGWVSVLCTCTYIAGENN